MTTPVIIPSPNPEIQQKEIGVDITPASESLEQLKAKAQKAKNWEEKKKITDKDNPKVASPSLLDSLDMDMTETGIRIKNILSKEILWGENGIPETRKLPVKDCLQIHFLLSVAKICRELQITLPPSGIETKIADILQILPKEGLRRLQEVITTEIAKNNDGRHEHITAYGSISLTEKDFDGTLTELNSDIPINHHKKHELARLHFLPAGKDEQGDKYDAAEVRVAVIDMARVAKYMQERKKKGLPFPKYIWGATNGHLAKFTEERLGFRQIHAEPRADREILHAISVAFMGGMEKRPQAPAIILLETAKLIEKLPELEENAKRFSRNEESARRMLIASAYPEIFEDDARIMIEKFTKDDGKDFKVVNVPIIDRLKQLSQNIK